MVASFIHIKKSHRPQRRQNGEMMANYCDGDSKISSSSQISKNINQLLVELVAKASSTGFLATSYGRNQDEVYGLAQCRGDVSSNECSTCIQAASKQIRESCPNQAGARIWYDYCFLRYAQMNFIGNLDTSIGIYFYNVENVSDPGTFNQKLGALMDHIEAQAIVPQNKGFGKGETKLSPFLTLYALVQCTRDLPRLLCAQCLAIAVGNFPNFCDSRKGCRVLYSSCYVRYELYPISFPMDSNNTLAHTVMKIVHP